MDIYKLFRNITQCFTKNLLIKGPVYFLVLQTEGTANLFRKN